MTPKGELEQRRKILEASAELIQLIDGRFDSGGQTYSEVLISLRESISAELRMLADERNSK